VPSNAQFKIANTLHRVVLAASFGKIGTKLLNMPVIELTTTGRKSGQPRTVMLTTPLREGTTMMVVGSRGGDDVTPAWVHNITANPEVQVKEPGQARKAMRARVATAEERSRLWPIITGKHKNYADYQTKTEREIPVVLLEPAG
jgi:deazaflavin-dependent oxidoreductase (nitroreductase family)